MAISNVRGRSALPTPDELAKLPRWAIVAFAANCARQAQPLFHDHWDRDGAKYVAAVEAAIQTAEQVAAKGVWSQGEDAAKAADEAAAAAYSYASYRQDHESDHADTNSYIADCTLSHVAAAARDAVYAALRAATFGQPVFSGDTAKSIAVVAAGVADASARAAECWGTPAHEYGSSAEMAAAAARAAAVERMRDIFDIMVSAAERERWSEDAVVSPSFFGLHSVFDLEAAGDRESIINVAAIIDARLIEYFHRYPKRLHDLTPWQFEELVAELFAGFGYKVALTARTRDGGFDVVAVNHSEVGHARYLIECKKLRSDRKVAVSAVRALHGVVVSEGATKGILATTARFSQPARRLFCEHEYILESRDFDGVVDWLNIYQRLQVDGMLGRLRGAALQQ